VAIVDFPVAIPPVMPIADILSLKNSQIAGRDTLPPVRLFSGEMLLLYARGPAGAGPYRSNRLC
jgi:hypothetical protein